MSYTDHNLRADTESELAEALPMLRAEGEWITADKHHAFDPIGPMRTQEPTYEEDGETVIDPGIIDTRFHANLRLRDDHPDRAAIEASIAPFLVFPEGPGRMWQ